MSRSQLLPPVQRGLLLPSDPIGFTADDFNSLAPDIKGKQNQLRHLQRLVDSRQTEAKMANTLLDSLVPMEDMVRFGQTERKISEKERILGEQEKRIEAAEKRIKASELSEKHLKFRLRSLQYREHDHQMRMADSVDKACQSDGGREVIQLEEERQEQLSQDILQHAAAAESFKNQFTAEELDVLRMRERIAQTSQQVTDEWVKVEQARIVMREAENVRVAKEAVFRREEAKLETIKRQYNRLQQNVEDLQGKLGSIEYERMLEEDFALNARLAAADSLMRKLSGQVADIEEVVLLDKELAQRRAVLAALGTLEERHAALHAETSSDKSQRDLAQLRFQDQEAITAKLKLDSTQLDERMFYAMALAMAIKRMNIAVDVAEKRVAVRKKVEQSFEISLNGRRIEAQLFGATGLINELHEEYSRLQGLCEQKRRDIPDLDKYVHVSHLHAKRVEERKQVEAAIAAVIAQFPDKHIPTKLRLQSDVQDWADKVVIARKAVENVVNDNNASIAENNLLKTEIKTARDALRKVRLEAAEAARAAQAAAAPPSAVPPTPSVQSPSAAAGSRFGQTRGRGVAGRPMPLAVPEQPVRNIRTQQTPTPTMSRSNSAARRNTTPDIGASAQQRGSVPSTPAATAGLRSSIVARLTPPASPMKSGTSSAQLSAQTSVSQLTSSTQLSVSTHSSVDQMSASSPHESGAQRALFT
eukprot:TRINITY_DN12940_c0_g1_i1.p1 TRINITY_DN12940_c0_g1~~TRINITY_DN12940_c0_g1_i1.p1  ORF type:complete len:702 (-),score=171.51 TRINITY_DN12940_c0_g1_i1:53-2158(-)